MWPGVPQIGLSVECEKERGEERGKNNVYKRMTGEEIEVRVGEGDEEESRRRQKVR